MEWYLYRPGEEPEMDDDGIKEVSGEGYARAMRVCYFCGAENPEGDIQIAQALQPSVYLLSSRGCCSECVQLYNDGQARVLAVRCMRSPALAETDATIRSLPERISWLGQTEGLIEQMMGRSTSPRNG